MRPPKRTSRNTSPSATHHRVVVFGDQTRWESCEGRGPRIVELTREEFERVQQGDAVGVFGRKPGLPVIDALRDLRTVKVSRPRLDSRNPGPAGDIDPTTPLFDSGDFDADEGRFSTDTIGRTCALARSLHLWAGVDARLDEHAPFRPVPEHMWWPHPRAWRPKHDGSGPPIRVCIGHRGGLPRYEEPALFVAGAWPNGHAVRRLVGDFGPVAEAARRREATARAMAVTAMCRAPGLPEDGPAWCLRRTDRSDPDRSLETVFHEPAFDRRAGDAVDELTWADLRQEIAPSCWPTPWSGDACPALGSRG